LHPSGGLAFQGINLSAPYGSVAVRHHLFCFRLSCQSVIGGCDSQPFADRRTWDVTDSDSRYGDVDVSLRTQVVEPFGRVYASPFGISPVWLSALPAYRGDIATAQAAQAADSPYVKRDVAAPNGTRRAGTSGLLVPGYEPGHVDRIEALIERVAAERSEALVVTVNTCVHASRENYIFTRFSKPLRSRPRLAFDGLVHRK
jgi:isopentenyl diphosphate isomerase/L-lactate dehydrogenase-like FMN-dependent dehydrogenase